MKSNLWFEVKVEKLERFSLCFELPGRLNKLSLLGGESSGSATSFTIFRAVIDESGFVSTSYPFPARLFLLGLIKSWLSLRSNRFHVMVLFFSFSS